MTHDFQRSLRMSQEQASAPWWEAVYREAFPAFANMTYVGDCPAQRDGIDRLVTTSNAHIYRIDEKVREKDYPDFFLEWWSVKPSTTHEGNEGWVAKDLACDFIAYAFIPSRRCYLLPFPSLRTAWRRNHKKWVQQYGRKDVPNHGYTTVGTPVPIDVVLKAISDAHLFTWNEHATIAQKVAQQLPLNDFEREWGPDQIGG